MERIPMQKNKRSLLQGVGLAVALASSGSGCISAHHERPSSAADIESEKMVDRDMRGIDTYFRGMLRNNYRVWLHPSIERSSRLSEIKNNFWENFRFREETLAHLLHSYPRFMVEETTVQRISYIDAIRTPSHAYREPTFAAGAATHLRVQGNDESGYSFHTTIVFTQAEMASAYGIHGVRGFNDMVAHELGHASDPTVLSQLSLERRLSFLKRLIRLTENPETMVRFANTLGIRSPHVGEQRLIVALEFHAEAIRFALTTRLEPGQSWLEIYRDFLMREFHVSRTTAEETAQYAIDYIQENDPSYDQAQAYTQREDALGALAQDSRGRFRFLEREFDQEDTNRMRERVETAIEASLRHFPDGQARSSIERVLLSLRHRGNLLVFFLYPEEFTKGRQTRATLEHLNHHNTEQRLMLAWSRFLHQLREAYRHALGSKNPSHQFSGYKNPEMLIQDALTELEAQLGSLIQTPTDERSFQQRAHELFLQELEIIPPRDL